MTPTRLACTFLLTLSLLIAATPHHAAAQSATPPTTADARLQTGVQDLDYGLAELKQLRPISFAWQAAPEVWQQGRKIGLAAQDVEKIMPELVATAKDGQGTKSIWYESMIPVLVRAVLQLEAENVALRARLDRVEKGTR